MSLKALSKACLILFFISPSVFAGAAFDGLNGQIGVGLANLGSESQWSSLYKYGEKGVLGNISLGYSRQLNNRFNIAANTFYSFLINMLWVLRTPLTHKTTHKKL